MKGRFHNARTARLREVLCRILGITSAILALMIALPAQAQTPARPQITQAANDASTVVLLGNIRAVARNSANDRGAVPESMPMSELMLQLRRPADREQAFEALIAQLHDPDSPSYHHWLTADEIGAQFGPADSDIEIVTNWLRQHGFTVNTVYPNKMAILFSGTAAQVSSAFHTEIHFIDVDGVTRYANVTDPSIPAALAPAVIGPAELHNIPARPMMKPAKIEYTLSGYSCGGFPCYVVTPQDLATIYNFNPVFSGGNTGQGQTIYLIEATDMYGGGSDWLTFLQTFGLGGHGNTLVYGVHPGNCTDPGINGADGELILDAEYANAAAPGADLVIASCTSILTAVQNLVNGASPPAIMSISYGFCEADGVSTAQAFSAAYQTGVAEGASIFVSSGDGGAAGCDNHDTAKAAQDGIGANGFASTPYNVSVGGTDFSDAYSGTGGTYWNTGNTQYYGSAKSYVPEIPWNSSCGSQLFATHFGYATTYGSSGFCNSSAGQNYQNIAAGSGAPSIVFSKPSWQSGLLGNPSDGARDQPDVSLFAASGSWGHVYLFCYSDSANGGNGCSGTPMTWNAAGGTSFASPIWAGIQALVNQKTGSKQGLPNTRLYQLAAQEYGSGGSSSCNASNGNSVGGACTFYDVTLGDNDVPCVSGYANCYAPGGSYGVLSTSTSSYQPAYRSTTGWDFATGIGTVNVANLVGNWVQNTSKLTDTHDFNGDGKSDILWYDSNGDIAVWLMNGASVTQSSALGNVPLSVWTTVGQRDFNGDGKADILWRDTSGNIAMWFMNGATVSQSSAVGNAPASVWFPVGTGDFNGDSKGDILWRDTSGDVAIWMMNGSTITQSCSVGNASPSVWYIAGTGDFNGDGKTDILWHDTSGNVAIWFMNGCSIIQSSAVGNAPYLVWSIIGTGDFNGDGKSDILWQDTSGNIAMWMMNGSTIS